VQDLDVIAVAKAMEAQLKAALAPLDADCVLLSRDEAVLTLGLLSALAGILEDDERSQSLKFSKGCLR